MKRKISFRLIPRLVQSKAVHYVLLLVCVLGIVFTCHHFGLRWAQSHSQSTQETTPAITTPKSEYSLKQLAEDELQEPAPLIQQQSKQVVSLTGDLYQPGYLITPNAGSICPERIVLLAVVISAPENQRARQAIRAGWGRLAKRRKETGVIFMLGRASDPDTQSQLTDEAEKYGDLVINNVLDTYENLTLKTLSAFDWHQKYCNHAKYVLKVDDDVFIQIARLLLLLRGLEQSPLLLTERGASSTGLILGNVASGWSPVRNQQSKYYISEEQYPLNKYPPFVTGPSYVVSSSAVKSLLSAAWSEPYMALEDVFLTGIVAEKCAIPRRLVLEFKNNAERVPAKFLGCTLLRTISIHKVLPEEQLQMQMMAKKPVCGPPK